MIDKGMTITDYELLSRYIPYAGFDFFNKNDGLLFTFFSDYFCYYNSEMLPNTVDIIFCGEKFRYNAVTMMKEAQTARNEIGKKAKSDHFFKRGTLHLATHELPVFTKIWGPPRRYQTSTFEETMRAQSCVGSGHFNGQGTIEDAEFDNEKKNIQMVSAVRRLRYDEKGALDPNGKFFAGSDFINHRLAKHVARFRYATDWDSSKKMFVSDRMSGDGELICCGLSYFWNGHIKDTNKLRMHNVWVDAQT